MMTVVVAAPSIVFIRVGVRDGSWRLPGGIGMTGHSFLSAPLEATGPRR